MPARSFRAGSVSPPAFRVVSAASGVPLQTGRPRLVVLGTGWGAARLVRDIDPSKWDITVISPRNHMVFTPLLASTCVGTVETRSVTLPIKDVQKALSKPQNHYYTAECTAVNPVDKTVECVSNDGIHFFCEYDALAIATGSQGSTFGIPGVEQYTHFLRNASDSTNIRNTLIHNWNLANIPGRSQLERQRLLHIVIVGGGPTGVEIAGELADFVKKDLMRLDPHRAHDMRITLVEASELLGALNPRLREYAAHKLTKDGVNLIKGVVKEVRETEIELHGSEGVLPYGLCIWSTGVGPTPFILGLPFARTQRGRLAVDKSLRVLAPPELDEKLQALGSEYHGTGPMEMKDVPLVSPPCVVDPLGVPLTNVFALGDCCACTERPLPPLAQVADQQGMYLAARLNETLGVAEPAQPEPFQYKHLGSMASVGGKSAVLEIAGRSGDGHPLLSWGGFSSWVAWRSAYLTRLGTWKHRLYVACNWTLTLVFGRDISRW